MLLRQIFKKQTYGRRRDLSSHTTMTANFEKAIYHQILKIYVLLDNESTPYFGSKFLSNVGVSPENEILAAQGSYRDYTHIENILKMNSELVCNRILWCSLKTNKRKKISTKEKKGQG